MLHRISSDRSSTNPNSQKVDACPYQGILQYVFTLWVNILVLWSVLVQVVVGEMMTAEHADHSKVVEAITSFFCGLSPFYPKYSVGSREGGECIHLFWCPWLQLHILSVIINMFNCLVCEPKVWVGVRGKYVCSGVNCMKWLNYSYNN